MGCDITGRSAEDLGKFARNIIHHDFVPLGSVGGNLNGYNTVGGVVSAGLEKVQLIIAVG